MVLSKCKGSSVSVPEICNDDFTFVPVNKLSEVNPDRDHAYILPNDDVYIVNHAGTRVMKLGSGHENSMFDEASDGLEIVTVNKIRFLKVVVGEGLKIGDNNEIMLDPGKLYVLPPATNERLGGVKVGQFLSVEVDGKLSVDSSKLLKDVATKEALREHIEDNNNPHEVTASQVGAYSKSESDSKDATTLKAAKDYSDLHSARRDNPHEVTASQTGAYTKSETDGKDSSTLASAKAYTDSHANRVDNPHKVSATQVGAYTKAETDSKDTATLNSAKAYSDLHSNRKDNPHQVTASQAGAYSKSETDSRDSTTLASAKAYSDAHANKKDNPHQVTASQVGTYSKIEIDAKDSAVLSAAKSDASGNDATTLANAKAYTDSHANRKDNPHSVTASQVGTYTKSEIDAKDTAVKNGNVASATKLQTERKINNVGFDGTKDITVLAKPDITQIVANTDLNSCLTYGEYCCQANVTVATLINCPTKMAFSMTVYQAAGWIQELREYKHSDISKMWIRKNYSGSWSPWILIPVADGSVQPNLVSQFASQLVNNVIASNTDLNSIATPGLYSTNTDANTQTLKNCPVTSSATMMVTTSYENKRVNQILQRITDGRLYSRGRIESGVWSPWITHAHVGDNVASATKLQTARTITVGGTATGSVAFDGSGNITLPVNVRAATTALSGIVQLNDAVNSTSTTQASTANATKKVQDSANTHIANKSNPHAVTAGQVGSYTKAETDTKLNGKTNVDGHSNGNITSYSGNLNDLKKSGTWMGNGVTNAPDTGWWYFQVMKHNDNYVTQVCWRLNQSSDLRPWIRSLVNGTWTGWQSIARNIDNVASATKLATARTINGVPFDGTGNVTIPVDKTTLLNMVYPIGCIYQSTNSTSPATLFGGTWERFAKGQVLVGVNESDADFVAGKTGGEKTHKLTVAEMPSHAHTQIFSQSATSIGLEGRSPMANNYTKTSQANSITASGGDSPHNNLQPYNSIYMWRRTA